MHEWLILAGAVCLLLLFVSLPLIGDYRQRNKESRQYRREMYRQQQASWHAQEEAWSRPVLDAKPVIRPTEFMTHARKLKEGEAKYEAARRSWECKGLSARGVGSTPEEAYRAWEIRMSINMGMPENIKWRGWKIAGNHD